jgi:MFS superfamily sulfate permease-like transporter
VNRANVVGQVVAGVALVAIAIPEQIATAQLADVPSYVGLVSFIAATLAFVVAGRHPVVSVGADSTIAPLFVVALVRLAAPQSTDYLALVAATAVVTGLLLIVIGRLQWGWLADLLSLPIVTGFMTGIGVIIIVHQLAHLSGVSSGGESVVGRVVQWVHQWAHLSGWTLGLGLVTVAVMVVGERWNPRLPWALVAVVGGALVTSLGGLASRGVQTLGTVSVGFVSWRLSHLHPADLGTVVVTSLTLVIVIMSQTGATARTTADELGIADDLSRDFWGVGWSNLIAGLVGTIPVDASPARTSVTILAGGRTKMSGLVAALAALAVLPAMSIVRFVPLASLAGVLTFVAARLIKVGQFRAIWRVSRVEAILALVAAVGVVGWGVEAGLGVAVALAIGAQTWHSARPHLVEMGRRPDSTSWEPLTVPGVARVEHVTVLLFDHDLFFANASQFRRLVHQALQAQPDTRHVVIDAAAMPDIDYTGVRLLDDVRDDLHHESVSLSLARPSRDVAERVRRQSSLTDVGLFDSVDEAVAAVAD